jgi:hypothetical protein
MLRVLGMASEASASRSIEAAEEWQKKCQTPTYLLLRAELNKYTPF